MFRFSFLKAILLVLPEQMLMIYVGLGLIGIKINFSDVLKGAVGGTLIVWLFSKIVVEK